MRTQGKGHQAAGRTPSSYGMRRPPLPAALPPKGPDVVVAVAHGPWITPHFSQCLVGLQHYDDDHERHIGQVSYAGGPLLTNNRNDLVRSLLQLREPEWLLMLDTDIVFPPDLLTRMFSKMRDGPIDMLAGLYRTMRKDVAVPGDLITTWCIPNPGGGLGQPLVAVGETSELIELASCGMGCTLIARYVLEAVWQAHQDDGDAAFARDPVTLPDQTPARLGEDVSFCLRARQLGFRILGAPDIGCGHVKMVVIPPREVVTT